MSDSTAPKVIDLMAELRKSLKRERDNTNRGTGRLRCELHAGHDPYPCLVRLNDDLQLRWTVDGPSYVQVRPAQGGVQGGRIQP